MPKLLSRSKHEEFKSNSSLQIRSQKERREKSEEKWSIAKFASCSIVHLSSHCSSCCPFLFLRCALFEFVFGFFLIYPCNSLPILVFFCNFSYTEHLYKPQSVQTLDQSLHVGNRQWAAVSPLLPPFSIFFHFLFHFLGCQTPFDDDKSKDVRLNLPHP